VEFDFPVNRPVNLLVNGALKFNGRIVNTGRKRAFHIMADPTEE